MPWVIRLTDQNGVKLGEASQATAKTFNYTWNGTPTVKFSLPLWDPLVSEIQDGRVLIKAYRGKRLRFVGDATSLDEDVSDSDQVATVLATGPFARLKKRLVGQSTIGEYYEATARNEIVADLLDQANAIGDTGIRAGTMETLSEVDAGYWRYKPISEAILELASDYDGFDFRVSPKEPTADSTGVQIASLYVASRLGAWQQDTKFDFGSGTNTIASYKRTVTFDISNKVYSLPPGFPDTTTQTVLSDESTDSQLLYGVCEALIDSDLSSDDLRALLLQQAAAIYGTPRQTFEVVLVPNMPYEPFEDFDVGDIVQLNLWQLTPNNDKGLRQSVLVRIYGMEITEDDEGGEQVKLTLVQDGSSAN